jgi:CrcB protein
MMDVFLIAIGGAFGSVLRFLTSNFVTKIIFLQNSSLSKFPFGTFFVNSFGSLICGLFYYLMIKNFENFDPKLKSFLLVGFLGGYTTFSAFCLDFFRLATAGQILQAFSYAAISVVFSIAMLFFGFYFAKLVF